MWSSLPHQRALLELVLAGELRRRKGQAEAWDHLAELPWVRRTSRRDVLRLRPDHRPDVEGLLDRVWEGWRADAEAMAAEGLAPSEHGELLRRRRAERQGRPRDWPVR